MTTAAAEINLENVPAIVRKQAEDAQKLFEVAKAAAAENGLHLPGETPVEKPPAALKEEPPKEEPPKEEPKAPTTFKEVATEEMTKEQRYKVLEGMQQASDRKARTARTEVEALQARIAELEGKLAAAPEPKAPAKTVPTADPEARTRLASVIGAESIPDMIAVLREHGFVISQDLNPVKDEVDRVSATVTRTAQDKFTTTLADLVPDFEEKNKDPGFIAFMNEPEGRTGIPRKQFAAQHVKNRDAVSLAGYFLDYDATVEAPPTAKPAAPKLDKKKLASPPATPTGARIPDEPREVEPVNESEVVRFRKDLITGKYAGRDAEVLTVNKRIDAAQRAGKIIIGK